MSAQPSSMDADDQGRTRLWGIDGDRGEVEQATSLFAGRYSNDITNGVSALIYQTV